MAFTSDGMFYLSQEDYAPTRDILGGGVRGLFGLQNKEEAVESVLRRTNPDDPASRESALMEIAAIDPDAWARVSAIFNEIDTSRIGLEEKRLDLKSKRGEADRNAKWAYEVKPNAIQYVANQYGVQATTEAEFINALNKQVEDGTRSAGSRGTAISGFKASMKEAEKNWKTTHKYTDFSSKDPTTTSSLLTGLPEKKDPYESKTVDELRSLLDAKLKERSSLPNVISKAMEANPDKQLAISESYNKRIAELNKEISRLEDRVDKDYQIANQKDVASIFEEHAKKFKK